jgi:hypothetical protein
MSTNILRTVPFLSNHFRLNWLFQPKSQAQSDQTCGKQGAKEEENSGYFLAAEQKKTNSISVSGAPNGEMSHR